MRLVHGLDPARHPRQLGQLLPVDVVVALQNAIDQLRRVAAGGQRRALALQRLELLEQGRQLVGALGAGQGQGAFTLATKIQLVLAQQGRGPGYGQRDLAQGLLQQRVRARWGVHDFPCLNNQALLSGKNLHPGGVGPILPKSYRPLPELSLSARAPRRRAVRI